MAHFLQVRQHTIRTKKVHAWKNLLLIAFMVVIASIGTLVTQRKAQASSSYNPIAIGYGDPHSCTDLGNHDGLATSYYSPNSNTFSYSGYNPLGTFTWAGSSAHGASSVVACNDGPTPSTSWDGYGEPFQCEELVQRYAYIRWDDDPRPASVRGAWGNGAANAWGTHPSHFQQINNSGSPNPPTAGDLLVWQKSSGNSNPNGHIAIIASVDVTHHSLTTLEQNFKLTTGGPLVGSDTMSFTSNNVIKNDRGDSQQLYGWLHDTSASPVPSHFTPLGGSWLLPNGTATSGVGLYNPGNLTFYLKNTFPASGSAGAADETIPLGDTYDLPLVGDWTGNGQDTIGVYRPSNATFYLANANVLGTAILTSFTYGDPNQGWLPIAGDWTGSGRDGVGLYDPSTSTFYLRNTLTGGVADETIAFGNPGDIPIVGNWYGTGQDVIGVYRPSNSTFYFASSNTPGTTTAFSIFYGNPGAGWLPVIGDWTGSRYDTIGLYDHTSATFYLRNSLSNGVADETFTYGDNN